MRKQFRRVERAPSSSGGSAGAPSNGVASKSADQIRTTAIAAAEAAKSVHVFGAINSGAQSVGLDLSIVQGKGATGTISEGPASFKLIETGGNFYMQPDQAFRLKFAHTKAAADLFKGKWLKGSSSDANFASFGELTSIKTLMGLLDEGESERSPRAPRQRSAGEPVIALNSSKGGTMYVATTGKALPAASEQEQRRSERQGDLLGLQQGVPDHRAGQLDQHRSAHERRLIEAARVLWARALGGVVARD